MTTVSFLCRKCKSRKVISKEQWLAGEVPLCCGQKMVYHGEDKPKIEIN